MTTVDFDVNKDLADYLRLQMRKRRVTDGKTNRNKPKAVSARYIQMYRYLGATGVITHVRYNVYPLGFSHQKYPSRVCCSYIRGLRKCRTIEPEGIVGSSGYPCCEPHASISSSPIGI